MVNSSSISKTTEEPKVTKTIEKPKVTKTTEEPKVTKTEGPKAGNVVVKYIGKKEYSSWTSKKLKKPVIFTNNLAEVPKNLGQAMVTAYPATFQLISGQIKETEKPLEV